MAACPSADLARRPGWPTFSAVSKLSLLEAPGAAMARAALDHRDLGLAASGAASRRPSGPCSAPARGRRYARRRRRRPGCMPGARPSLLAMSTTYSLRSKVAFGEPLHASSSGRISGHSNFSISAQEGTRRDDVVARVDPGRERRRRPCARRRRPRRCGPAPAAACRSSADRRPSVSTPLLAPARRAPPCRSRARCSCRSRWRRAPPCGRTPGRRG